MGANKEWQKGLKDVTPEEKRLAEELDREERQAGIPHPEENIKVEE